jgi:hypothetical protein
MKRHMLSFPPSPNTQVVVANGPGRLLHITISHNVSTSEQVTFYNREGGVLAMYMIHPLNSPYTITYSNRDVFPFYDGLMMNTGACSVNLVLVF